MRLPPPPRRYSAISVMVLTPEAASRPNSCSIATRSSLSRSKTSLAVGIANVLKALRFSRFLVRCGPCRPCATLSESGNPAASAGVCSVGAVVGKLQFQTHILAAQQGDDGLQLVAVLARYSHRIALDAGLRLPLRVLDQANDLLGLFDGDALLQFDS